MITEEQMPLETMERRTYSHKCAVCSSMLTVAWGGSFGFNGYVLRCGNDSSHEGITNEYKSNIRRGTNA